MGGSPAITPLSSIGLGAGGVGPGINGTAVLPGGGSTSKRLPPVFEATLGGFTGFVRGVGLFGKGCPMGGLNGSRVDAEGRALSSSMSAAIGFRDGPAPGVWLLVASDGDAPAPWRAARLSVGL